MPQVHTLSVGIKANAKAAMNELQAFMNSLNRMKNVALGVGSALLVGSAAKSFFGGIRKAGDELDRVDKVASALGEKLSTMREIEFAAGISNIQPDSLLKFIVRMRKSMSDAVNNGKPLAGIFDAAKLSAMPLTEQLGTIADQFKRMDTTARAVFVRDIFGRNSTQMMAFLDQGSAGLKNMQAQFGFLGITISETAGKQMRAANDDLGRMKSQWEQVKTVLAVAFYPVISQLSKQLMPLIKTFLDRVQLGGIDLTGLFATAAEGAAKLGDELLKLKASIIALKIVSQEQFNFPPRVLFGVTQDDIADWKADLQKVEKTIADRRLNGTAGGTFIDQFKKNRAEWEALLNNAPVGGDGGSLLAGDADATVPLGPPPDVPIKVHLSSDSIEGLRRGTVDAATEVSRLQRAALLEPQLVQFNKEDEARKQALAEAKKHSRLLEQVARNTRNAVVLDEADLD